MFRNIRDLFHNVDIADEEQAIEEIARRVVRDGIGAAAIVFLESSKPISFLSGQAAIVATPFLGAFIAPSRIERYADLFSRRDFIERIISRIEELEAEQAGESPTAGEGKLQKSEKKAS